MQKKKFNLSGIFAIILAILILLIAVPINLIFSYADKVYDMTPAGKYTLNEKTVQLLDETADKQIEIYYLYEYSLSIFQSEPEFLPLYHTLDELSQRDNIELITFNPDEEAERASALDPAGILGINKGDIFVKCGDVIKKIDPDRVFQTTSDGIFQYAGEELIASAIKVCTSGSLPTVYFLTGHGEKSINDSYATYADTLKTNNYDVQEMNLDETGAIPDNTAIVYIVGLTEDITNSEFNLLSSYVDNGGSLAVFASPCDTKGRFTNLDKLLEKFELGIDYNYVTETNSVNQLQNMEAKQSDNYFRVQYTPATEDFTEDLTTDINSLINQGIYTAGISNTRSVYEYTSDSAYIEKSPIVQNIMDATTSKYTTVSTAMGGDSWSQSEAENLSGEELYFGYYSYNKQTLGKLILFGTTDIMDPENLNYMISGTQYLAIFSNTWLYDTDIEMGIGNKSSTYDNMHFSDAPEAESVLRIFIIVPIVVAIIGIAVWLKRRYA
ncbi:MAG: GldG family protein [Ruminococcus flavefaciens]|nr:GldG family protein [Ruminococcus flavefaciens]